MDKLERFIVTAFLFGLLLISANGNEKEIKIKIKDSVVINDSKMYLSDFIETDNLDLFQKTKEILIGYFLYPIKERKIKGDYIKLKLKQAGIKDFEKIQFPLEIMAVRYYIEDQKKEKAVEKEKKAISFKNNIKINSEKIYLSDIIAFADKEIMEKASQILVGYVLSPGEEKIISSDTIKLKIKQMKISGLEEIGEIEPIKVTREYQTLDKQMLENMIYGVIKNIYNEDSFSIKVDTYENEKYVLPPGILNIDIKDSRLDGIKIGKMTIIVSVLSDNSLLKKINANIEIGKNQKIMVLNKDANKGDLLSQDMYIEKEKIFYTDIKNGYIKDVEQFRGKIFKRNMKKNEILQESDFEKRKIFKKGEIVKVIIELDGATLKTDAKAMQDGFEGESVNISNEKTKKILTGTVQEDGTVIINVN